MPAVKDIFRLSLFFIIGLLISNYNISAASDVNRFNEIKTEYFKLRNYITANINNEKFCEQKLPKAFDQIWSLMADWVVTYLENTPNASPEHVAKKLEELDPPRECANTDIKCWDEYHIDATAVQLAEGDQAAYAVSVNLHVSGTFFIVQRKSADKFQAVWNIKELATKHYASRDEIGYWAHMGFSYIDGPLIGHVSMLSPGNKGVPRFLIDAMAFTMRSEFPKQVSIWEWNGQEAIPLLIKSYRSTINTGEIAFDGRFLKIPTKEDYKTFFSSSMGPEAKVIWTVKVGLGGIEDLGKIHETPELQWMDQLWSRLLSGKKAEDMASPQVIGILKQIIREEKISDSLGMLGDWNVKRSKKHTVLRFTADDLVCRNLYFKVEKRNNKPYFSKIRFCDNCECHCLFKGINFE
jgi:hypothetical protein